MNVPELQTAVRNRSGLRWPGANRLSDEQAAYLFDTFARSVFAHDPQQSLFNNPELPEHARRPFEAARCDEIWSMPRKNWVGLDNSERTVRMNELKILVVDYFTRNDLPRDGSSPASQQARRLREGIRGALELDDHDPSPLEQLLDELPVRPAEPAPVVSMGTGVEELGALLAGAGGPERRWLAAGEPTRLEVAVADLDLQVTAYSAAAADGGGDGDPEALADLSDQVAALQREVQEHYDALIDLAGGSSPAIDQQTLAAVRDRLDGRIRDLTAFSPDSVPANASPWRWYGGPDAGEPISSRSSNTTGETSS